MSAAGKQIDEIFVHVNKLDKFGKNIIQNNSDLAPRLNSAQLPSHTTAHTVSMSNSELPPITKRQLSTAEKYGRAISSQYPELRDLSVVMEHPEFYQFYQKYMNEPERMKRMLVLMKMYSMISAYLKEKDPTEEHHNAFHKLVFLQKILANPVYSRILFKKSTSRNPSQIAN